MDPKMISELMKEWSEIKVTDTIYYTGKGTEIHELEIKTIKNQGDFILVAWGGYRGDTIRIYSDNQIKKYRDHKWVDGSDQYFMQEWKAKKQINKNIDKKIRYRWGSIRDLHSEIGELKSQYHTEV